MRMWFPNREITIFASSSVRLTRGAFDSSRIGTVAE